MGRSLGNSNNQSSSHGNSSGGFSGGGLFSGGFSSGGLFSGGFSGSSHSSSGSGGRSSRRRDSDDWDNDDAPIFGGGMFSGTPRRPLFPKKRKRSDFELDPLTIAAAASLFSSAFKGQNNQPDGGTPPPPHPPAFNQQETTYFEGNLSSPQVPGSSQPSVPSRQEPQGAPQNPSGGSAPPPLGHNYAPAPKKTPGWRMAVRVIGMLLLALLVITSLGNALDPPKPKIAPLSSDAASISGWYTDADGDWIHDPKRLEKGLIAFHEQTGIAPYVYILPNGSETSMPALISKAEQLYPQLFHDQAHFLLVFCDDGNGGFNCGYAMGSLVKPLMTKEKIDQLADSLNKHYGSAKTEEDIFSKTFSENASRVVPKQAVSPAIYVLTALLAGGLLGFWIYRIRLNSKRLKEAHQAARIEDIMTTTYTELSADDPAFEELVKEYEGASASSKGKDQ